jgi:hypothetical protein
MIIPHTDNTPLVRTYFGDAPDWQTLLHAVQTPNADGFQAYVSIIDDPAFAECDSAQLSQSADAANRHALIIIADVQAIQEAEHPLFCIDTATGKSIRVIAAELWGIENNLAIGNMDFGDFVTAAGADGIFRGF